MSTPLAVRRGMRGRLVSNEGDRLSWIGHVDSAFQARGATLATMVVAVLRVVWLIAALPPDYRGKLRVLRTKISFLQLCMLSRLLCRLGVVISGSVLLLPVLVGIGRCPRPTLVRFLACWTDNKVLILCTSCFGFGFENFGGTLLIAEMKLLGSLVCLSWL